jgi:hypothetical protein
LLHKKKIRIFSPTSRHVPMYITKKLQEKVYKGHLLTLTLANN